MDYPTVAQMSELERARAVSERAVIALDPAASAWRYRVTVGQWDQRPDELVDVPAYLYLAEDAALQLDAWRVVDGVDKHADRDTYDVWLANGGCLNARAADFQIYLGEPDYQLLMQHLEEMGRRYDDEIAKLDAADLQRAAAAESPRERG